MGSSLRRVGAVVLLAQVGCAIPLGTPLRLPPASAPIELRAAVYRQNMAAMRASLWRGWRVRVGDARSDLPLREARPLLENSPEASRVLRERDRRSILGWTLSGSGLAAMVGGSVAFGLVLRSDGRDDERVSPMIPLLVAVAGVALLSAGTLTVGAADAQIPLAVDEYNRWLWDALRLPRALPTPNAPWAQGASAPSAP